MQERPYTLLGSTALHQLRGRLAPALGAWCDDWGLPAADLQLAALRASDSPLPPSADAPSRQWRRGEARLSLTWAAEWPDQLRWLMFGRDRHNARHGDAASLAGAAAAAAWDDWQRRLVDAVLPGGEPDEEGGDARQLASIDRQAASGAAVLVLRVGGASVHATLNDVAVRALLAQARPVGDAPTPEALAPMSPLSLLAAVPVELAVGLGRVDITLADLRRLEPGDVIRLEVGADHALAVTGPAGAILFGGYLGKKDGHVALELVRHPG